MSKKSITLKFDANSGGLVNIPTVNDLDIDFDMAMQLKDILYHLNEKIPDRRPCFPRMMFLLFAMVPCLACTIAFNVLYFPLGFPFLPVVVFGYCFVIIPPMWFQNRSEGLCHDTLVAIDEMSSSEIRATYLRHNKTKQMTNFTISVDKNRKR